MKGPKEFLYISNAGNNNFLREHSLELKKTCAHIQNYLVSVATLCRVGSKFDVLCAQVSSKEICIKQSFRKCC